MSNRVTEAFIVHDEPELGDYLTRSREAAERSGLRYTELTELAALENERFSNAVLFTALYELVDAIEKNSGAEPSQSVYDRALDEAKEACCYYAATPSAPNTTDTEE